MTPAQSAGASPTAPSVSPGLVLTDEFTSALGLLATGSNLFLTGRAGTGKSTLIRHFTATSEQEPIVVAPTGIAALNVDGYTIHRLFGFHPQTTLDHVRSRDYYPGKHAQVLKRMRTLIIDEASMVRADVFDCIAAALERFGPKPGAPFGGVQLVLVGDLYQLPPVVTLGEADYFTTAYESPFFFSAGAYETEDFPVVELTTVFRQIGDDHLVRLLNAVRDGSLDAKTRSELNERVREDFVPPVEERWLTLTTTNRIAGARNKTMLDLIDAPAHTSEAEVRGELDGFEPTAERELTYKPGAQIMMLTNDPMERWVNGTIAEVVDAPSPDLVEVRLPDGTVAEVGPHIWHVTRPQVEGGRLVHEPIGSFTQLPFKLAWAITIHKSQGQTLDRCVVDLSGGTFADGQLYVGLSRCTSLEGLVLTREIAPKDLKVNQRIRRYLQSGGRSTRATGTAYLGICPVGEAGWMSRPRPVEIAVVTESGNEISTLVNPERDMGDARTSYGITASDVLLAPRLHEAWVALAPFLAGRTPVGHDIDRVLGDLDHELKRSGVLAPVPVGNDLTTRLRPDESERLTAGTALERARAARDVDVRSRHRSSSDVFPEASEGAGYLLPRDTEPTTFLVTGSGEFADLLADLMAARAETAARAPEAAAVLRALERRTGRDLTHGSTAKRTIDDVLVPDTGICFSGSARGLDGRSLDREALRDMARERRLNPVDAVTKSKCGALVTAEIGSQSGKTKKARGWGIPVYTVDEFIHWHAGLPAPDKQDASYEASIRVLPVPVPDPVPDHRPLGSDRGARPDHDSAQDGVAPGHPGAVAPDGQPEQAGAGLVGRVLGAVGRRVRHRVSDEFSRRRGRG